VLGIDVRQGVWLRRGKRRPGAAEFGMAGPGKFRRTDRLRMLRAGVIIGAQVNPKMEAAEGEAIVRQEGGAAHPLAIDARPVGAPQITQQQKAIGLYDHAVHLGNAFVIQAEIAILFAPDDYEVALDFNWWTPVKGNELSPHSQPAAPLRFRAEKAFALSNTIIRPLLASKCLAGIAPYGVCEFSSTALLCWRRKRSSL
jgi:hypothetical protein